ncbi:hypothetical protein EXIGLDRAFT_233487 [Exidia glandulosa HHB12029]|uniref:Uncharacterized protein n=1 Tax=Exidia glandulosa HHB12029 TaxID=1314781 RepID=A0A165MIW0_EXIGL|nr:hypothetical protein EXIGLDRAFT_233487 [Exidia glandulosa HHB12029]
MRRPPHPTIVKSAIEPGGDVRRSMESVEYETHRCAHLDQNGRAASSPEIRQRWERAPKPTAALIAVTDQIPGLVPTESGMNFAGAMRSGRSWQPGSQKNKARRTRHQSNDCCRQDGPMVAASACAWERLEVVRYCAASGRDKDAGKCAREQQNLGRTHSAFEAGSCVVESEQDPANKERTGRSFWAHIVDCDEDSSKRAIGSRRTFRTCERSRARSGLVLSEHDEIQVQDSDKTATATCSQMKAIKQQRRALCLWSYESTLSHRYNEKDNRGLKRVARGK